MFARSTAIEQLREIIAKPKTFANWPVWESNLERTTTTFQFVSTLVIDGVGVDGLRLIGNASSQSIDSDIVILLNALIGNKFYNIYRLEYLPLRGHTNLLSRRDLPRRIDAHVSHHHSFNQNAKDGLEAFTLNNLPAALPFEPQPNSVKSFMRIIGNNLNIADFEHIDLPQWQGRLL